MDAEHPHEWSIGDTHPVTGCVCVAVVDGSPRWDYPKGHPYDGVMERIREDERERASAKGSGRKARR